MTRKVLEALRAEDQDAISVLEFHKRDSIWGSDLDNIWAMASEYDCQLEIAETVNILIKDIYVQVRGKVSNLILFYIAYSNFFGEPGDTYD